MNQPSKSRAEQIQDLEARVALHERERDAWKGKSAHHYEMGTQLVNALRAQLAALIVSGP